MRIRTASIIAGLLCVLLTASSRSQETPRADDTPSIHNTSKNNSNDRSDALTQDDRLSLIAAALDARVRNAEADCSHLVHAVYEQAGFPYSYAPSSDLYAGADGFRRVKEPETGDLVAWRGHVGIVIKPSQHLFFSFLSSGPGIDDYLAPYWKHRGKPRFYRYVKSDSCCDVAHNNSHRLLKVKK